ncbi:MAG: glycosyltransferase family 4 protein [Deltaproteobacteria bacterium]|nr:glycosyltransferase family 4 protein [Deltaproteobacteria bacterium]
MSRIALDLRMLVEPPDGVSRYSLELLRRLPALLPRHDLCGRGEPAAIHPELPEARVLPARSRPVSTGELLELAWLMHHHDVDLFHGTLFSAPPLGYRSYLLTIHDAIYVSVPELYGRRMRLYFETAVRFFAKRAQALLTVSEFSRRELELHLGIPAERIEVIPNGIDPRFRPVPAEEIHRVRERLALPEEYLLYVGGFVPHKNVPFLLRSYARVKDAPPLVLCGRHPERVRPEVVRCGLATRTIVLPGQGHDTLPALYSGAQAFLFPSRYEGFGLPPLEAMACGTPTIVSDAGSLPEVTGGAALTFPLDDEGALVGRIHELLQSRERRAELSSAGRAHAARFRWDECARRVAAVYQRFV